MSIPNALADALGSIVSLIVDARDIYPDDQTTLQAVTEAVNELYCCVQDGVFGPIDSPASAIEARSGETTQIGSTEGESAVGNAETPKGYLP